MLYLTLNSNLERYIPYQLAAVLEIIDNVFFIMIRSEILRSKLRLLEFYSQSLIITFNCKQNYISILIVLMYVKVEMCI